MKDKKPIKRSGDGPVATLFRGLWRTLCGAAITAGIVSSYLGYTMIPNESGYLAVASFACCSVVLTVSLVLMYIMGCRPKRHGNQERKENA